MHTNQYLYGEDVEVPDIIMRRIELLNDHLTEVNNIHYSERDDVLRNKLIEAIEFWENINER